MRLDNARVLVAGATGVLGGVLAEQLHAKGARLALAGRDATRLEERAQQYQAAPFEFEAYDLDTCAGIAARAAEQLGGLDAVISAVGVAAFGPASQTSETTTEHLFTVNALAPIAVLRGGLGVLDNGGAVAALTAITVDMPVPQMAAYTASKAGLSGWLSSARREHRRGLGVLDARAPHMETGLAQRAIAGQPPAMPQGADPQHVVATLISGMEQGASVLRADPRSGELTVE